MSRLSQLTILGLIFFFASAGCTSSTGIIRLNTDPVGAKYYVDGVEKGTTPAEFEWSYDRPIMIELRKEGYYTEEELLNKGWLHYQMSLGNYGEIPAGKVTKKWTVLINRKLKVAPRRVTGESSVQ
ncbi:MAG: PEGA domain-containing protein [Deltaproteobacteria bacterium]|jgi:hypothetical protein